MDSKSRCLWPFSEHCFYATYFNIPVAEVSCVCNDKAWCPLATVDVDSIILPHGKSLPVCEMGTIKFSLESPSSVSTPHCPKLKTYGICEAMCFARAYNALGQCWIQYHCQELMYIINQEKTPLQMDFTAAMLSLSLYRIYRIILPHLCF